VRTYGARVRELLEEMESAAGGKLRLEVIDPQPFSEAEDRATGFGLQAVPLSAGGDSLFFGLAGTNSTDGQAVIPFFQPDKEAFLEYDVAKLIASLAIDDKPVVGLLSSLPMGPGFDPATRSASEGWVVYSELAQLFELRNLEPGLTAIAEDVDLVVLVHPKDLSGDTLYAIDQFVLRGGRLVVFVDPHSGAEQPAQGMDPSMAMFQPRSSSLDTLFQAWGVRFDPSRVVLDAQNALQIQGPQGDLVRHLAILGLGLDDLNQKDVVSAELEALNLATAGWFELTDEATATLEPLAQSSAAVSAVGADRVRFLPDPESLFDDFEPQGEPRVLAARLTGALKTAFPERSGEAHLAESRVDANLILVADTDLLTDRLWVQVQPFLGQRLLNAFANNGDFVVNAVDNLVGSAELISVRARASSQRPFGTVEALKRRADDRFRQKEQELQAQLAETERRLTELQSARSDQQSLMLTPEQQAALERFQDEKLRIRKELRQVRRQLDADIESLGATLKFINIAAVPILITLLAVGLLAWRARRRANAVRGREGAR
jgi:ABC-type uncharacterized transport system involved in gliding motility auxiliary subunit